MKKIKKSFKKVLTTKKIHAILCLYPIKIQNKASRKYRVSVRGYIAKVGDPP